MKTYDKFAHVTFWNWNLLELMGLAGEQTCRVGYEIQSLVSSLRLCPAEIVISWLSFPFLTRNGLRHTHLELHITYLLISLTAVQQLTLLGEFSTD